MAIAAPFRTPPTRATGIVYVHRLLHDGTDEVLGFNDLDDAVAFMTSEEKAATKQIYGAWSLLDDEDPYVWFVLRKLEELPSPYLGHIEDD